MVRVEGWDRQCVEYLLFLFQAEDGIRVLVRSRWLGDVYERQDMLANRGKIMGFGHAIYSECDPRNAIIKEFSKELSLEHGDDSLYQVSEEVEKVMWDEKKLFPNADFFHASAYLYLGIPTKLFTPIFVMSRVTGWTAHCMEQRANNRIIRPSADYTGPESSVWVNIEDRE